jgi:hypothetical protein
MLVLAAAVAALYPIWPGVRRWVRKMAVDDSGRG